MVDFKIGSVDRSLVTTSTSTEDIKKQLETVSIDPNVTFTTGHPFPCPIIDLACPVCSTDDFSLKIPSRVVKLARNSKWGGKD